MMYILNACDLYFISCEVYSRSCFVNSVFIRDLFNTLWCLFYNLVKYTFHVNLAMHVQNILMFILHLYPVMYIGNPLSAILVTLRKIVGKVYINIKFLGDNVPRPQIVKMRYCGRADPTLLSKAMLYIIICYSNQYACNCLVFFCKLINFVNRNSIRI